MRKDDLGKTKSAVEPIESVSRTPTTRAAGDPHPLAALAIGLVYVFRTEAGARMMRELEQAIRRYAADPRALWRLVREQQARTLPEPRRGDLGEVIDTTLADEGE